MNPHGPLAIPGPPVNPAVFAQFNVNASTDLATITPAWIGAWAYVATQRCGYMAVPVGKGDIAGTGVDWKRDPATSDPAWASQAAWYIGTAGSDDATGADAAHPLRTYSEVQKRLSDNELTSALTTVTFLDAAGSITADLRLKSKDQGLVVQGTPVQVGAADTVAAYTDRVFAANTWCNLTATTLASFAPLLGNRIRLTSGTHVGAIAWVASANPEGSGVKTARVSPFMTRGANGAVGSKVNPSPGDTFVVESVPDCLTIEIILRGPRNAYGVATATAVNSLIVQDLGASVASRFDCFADGTALASLPLIRGCFLNNPQMPYAGSYSPTVETSRVLGELELCWFLYSGCLVGGVGSLGAIFIQGTPRFPWFQDCLFQNMGLTVGGGAYFERCGSFDCTAFNGKAVYVMMGAQATFDSGHCGAGNTIGLHVENGGRVFWQTTKPSFVGTTATIRTPLGDFVWADAPLSLNQRSGTGVLSTGGTATVTSKNMPASARITATPQGAPSGTGSPGTLSVVSSANLGTATASFNVQSYAAGAALTTDRTNFDWAWQIDGAAPGGLWPL